MPWFLAVTTDYFCTYVTRKTTWLELGFRIARLKTLTGSLWWNWLWNWPTQNYTDQHRFSHDLTQELVSVFSHDPLEAGCSALRTTANWSSSLAASAKVLGLWSINQSRRSLSTLLLNCLHTMRSRSSVIRMSTLTLNPMRKLCVETKSKLRVRFWVTLG